MAAQLHYISQQNLQLGMPTEYEQKGQKPFDPGCVFFLHAIFFLPQLEPAHGCDRVSTTEMTIKP